MMQVCHVCHLHFCTSCIITIRDSRNPPSCRTCSLLQLDVIERFHLTGLSLIDLKYFAQRKRIDIPVNVTQDEIIEIIISRQAKDLSIRARRALSLVTSLPPGATFENVDTTLLEPQMSTYSSGGHLGDAGETVAGKNSSSESPNKRKRARKVMTQKTCYTMYVYQQSQCFPQYTKCRAGHPVWI